MTFKEKFLKWKDDSRERKRKKIEKDRVALEELSTKIPAPLGVKEALGAYPLPDREVSLNDISLYKAPIDWDEVKELTGMINRIKETPVEPFQVEQLRDHISRENFAQARVALGWVASGILHYYDRSKPVIRPGFKDVAGLKRIAGVAGEAIGWFSKTIKYRFERFVEKIAYNEALGVRKKVTNHTVFFGQIDNPRASFLSELGKIYNNLAKPRVGPGGFLGLEDEVPVPIEHTMTSFFEKIGRLNADNLPLTVFLVEALKVPEKVLVNPAIPAVLGAISVELLDPIHNFLVDKHQTAYPVPRGAPIIDSEDPETWVNVFEPFSLWRSLVSDVGRERLNKILPHLPGILDKAYDCIPTSGPEMEKYVISMAENILLLLRQGLAGDEIVRAMFKKPVRRA